LYFLDDIKKTAGLISELRTMTKDTCRQSTYMIPDEVLNSIIQTRIFFRIREINKKQNQKVHTVNQQKKKKIQKFVK